MVTWSAVLGFIKEYGVILTTILGLISLIVAIQRFLMHNKQFQLQLIQEHREQYLLQVEKLKERRDEEKIAIQERRLAEVNVKIGHSLTLTEPSKEASKEIPFVIFRLNLENIGDGPVDILASLASSRIMNSKFKPGIGLRNRDVEWDDFEAHFWNHPDPEGLFTGNSTTRGMIAYHDEFLRLAAHEQGDLRRIDGVNNVPLLITRAPVYLMYRVFLVSRGYPLGEISRQLGAHPPKIIQTIDELKLQFRNLAQPNYVRWKDVQQALLNLNRLAFKIAAGEDDILGQLADPDAFRFFLLHHWDFLADIPGVGGNKIYNDIVNEFWQRFYPSKILPRDFANPTDPHFQAAQAFCQASLAPMLAHWERLKRTIRECKAFDRVHAYPASAFTPDPETTGPHNYPHEGYPVRIHTDPFYQQRWLGLMREGYLVSRPYSRILDENKPVYDKHDIPRDPRVLEPFVMRTYYLLDTLKVGPQATF